MAQVSGRVPDQLHERLMALPPMDLPGRLERLRELLGRAGCEALLVSDLANVRYLTGFSGSAGLLLVKAEEAVLVTDGRYKDQAQDELARSGAEASSVARKAQGQLELLGQLSRGVGQAGPGGGARQLGQTEALGRGLGERIGPRPDQRARRSPEGAQGRRRDSPHRDGRGDRRRGSGPGEANARGAADRSRSGDRAGHRDAPARG